MGFVCINSMCQSQKLHHHKGNFLQGLAALRSECDLKKTKSLWITTQNQMRFKNILWVQAESHLEEGAKQEGEI